MKLKRDSALIIVDLQNDFLPGGALGVEEGDAIIPIINNLTDQFDLVVASQDIHPERHVSFAETHGLKVGDTINLDGQCQTLWPIHCVENTKGAAYTEKLKNEKIKAHFQKGTHPHIDSYSAFFDNDHEYETKLDKYLREREVKTLFIVGLTTDFCVKFTALDALALDYKVVVIRDACKPVFEEEEVLKELQKKGAEVIFSHELLRKEN